mgnify:CR=1 FL=1|jgi:DNA-binding transcriptional ArsR family regulator
MKSDNAIAALGALAQTDRLAAFRLVLGAGKSGMASGRIASELNVQPTRMSFHLSTLERAGVLCSCRDGRHVRYAVNLALMRDLLGFLTDECCGGHPEICAELSTSAQKARDLEEIS